MTTQQQESLKCYTLLSELASASKVVIMISQEFKCSIDEALQYLSTTVDMTLQMNLTKLQPINELEYE